MILLLFQEEKQESKKRSWPQPRWRPFEHFSARPCGGTISLFFGCFLVVFGCRLNSTKRVHCFIVFHCLWHQKFSSTHPLSAAQHPMKWSLSGTKEDLSESILLALIAAHIEHRVWRHRLRGLCCKTFDIWIHIQSLFLFDSMFSNVFNIYWLLVFAGAKHGGADFDS